MELRGHIVKILPLQSGEGRNGTWKRQDFIVEYDQQYPKIVCFTLRGNRIDQYPLVMDEEVVVSFNIESREYNGRYYTDVKAWKVEKATAQQAPETETGNTPETAPDKGTQTTDPDFSEKDEKDDLPF